MMMSLKQIKENEIQTVDKTEPQDIDMLFYS